MHIYNVATALVMPLNDLYIVSPLNYLYIVPSEIKTRYLG